MISAKLLTHEIVDHRPVRSIQDIEFQGIGILCFRAAAIAAHICRNICPFHTLVPNFNDLPTATLVHNTFKKAPRLRSGASACAAAVLPLPNSLRMAYGRSRGPWGFAVIR